MNKERTTKEEGYLEAGLLLPAGHQPAPHVSDMLCVFIFAALL